jgi:murein DD-endopeptidase MepM/ murein hydrolase activator NlpD
LHDAGIELDGTTEPAAMKNGGQAREKNDQARPGRPLDVAELRLSAQRKLKLYLSAGRVALGQNRWLAATGLASALSLGLLGMGLAALVTPYSGVSTAALTAEDAPQIIAESMAGPAARIALHPDRTPVETAALEGEAAVPAADAAANPPGEGAPRTAEAAQEAASGGVELAALETSPQETGPQETHTRIEIDSGQTLMQVLTDAGADRVDAYHAIAALKPLYSPTKLRAGQKIALTFLETPAEDPAEASPARLLTAISLQPDIERAISVRRTDDGSYTTQEVQKELKSGFVRAKGAISSSLFMDADKAGIPAPIIVEMIRMFSYSIDFQREIHPGDHFEVFFDRKYDEDGTPVKEGQIAYASLAVNGKTYRLWRFQTADGGWDYFDENGNSMKKFLMKTPIDGARISSGFGMRRHPILGYSKLHSGVDFAAPKGTPIYAAGDGVVQKAGWSNGYGNYVQIRHANGYETGYGHMSAYAKGVRAGTRVRQGQVIGYVGSTGRSTGPHLHYEIHIAGKKVNPLGVKMATGVKLTGKQLAAFKATRAKTSTQMAEAPLLTKVAQAAPAGNRSN